MLDEERTWKHARLSSKTSFFHWLAFLSTLDYWVLREATEWPSLLYLDNVYSADPRMAGEISMWWAVSPCLGKIKKQMNEKNATESVWTTTLTLFIGGRGTYLIPVRTRSVKLRKLTRGWSAPRRSQWPAANSADQADKELSAYFILILIKTRLLELIRHWATFHLHTQKWIMAAQG